MFLKKLLIIGLCLFSVSNTNADTGKCRLIKNPSTASNHDGKILPNANDKITPIGSNIPVANYYYCAKNLDDRCDDGMKIVFGNETRFNWLGTFDGPATYKCRVRLLDAFWERGDLSDTPACNKYRDISNRKQVSGISDTLFYFCRPNRYLENHCVVAVPSDLCYATKDEADCIESGNWDDNAGRCKTAPEPQPNPGPKPKPDPDQKKKGGGSSCLNRPTANGRACCRVGNTTVYDSATDTCTCVIPGTKTADTTKEWKHDDGAEYGACITKGSTEVVNPCDAICTSFVNINVSTTCAAKSMTSVIAQITNECQVSNRAKCNGENLQKLVTQVEVAVADCSQQPVEPEINKKRLVAAVAAIDKYRSGLDVSVWKDAEGNFNTARLVSDSIAGVVLGTAGGLITSSVVKKNQVKNGFEDVVCTIGGQTVGSYGDEISVGIQ